MSVALRTTVISSFPPAFTCTPPFLCSLCRSRRFSSLSWLTVPPSLDGGCFRCWVPFLLSLDDLPVVLFSSEFWRFLFCFWLRHSVFVAVTFLCVPGSCGCFLVFVRDTEELVGRWSHCCGGWLLFVWVAAGGVLVIPVVRARSWVLRSSIWIFSS